MSILTIPFASCGFAGSTARVAVMPASAVVPMNVSSGASLLNVAREYRGSSLKFIVSASAAAGPAEKSATIVPATAIRFRLVAIIGISFRPLLAGKCLVARGQRRGDRAPVLARQSRWEGTLTASASCRSSSGRQCGVDALARPHPFSCRTLRAKPTPSKRVWTDDFPVVAIAELIAFVVVDRAVVQELLDVAAGCGRGVHEQDAAGFAAGALPGMWDVAREERAGAGPADGDLVADLEGDLAGEHPGDLVAVAVQMEQALGADGH